MFETAPTNAPRRELRFGILLEHIVTAIALVALAVALRQTLPLSQIFLWKVVTAVLVGGAVTLSFSLRCLPTSTLGAANNVTLARAGLVALLIGLIGETHVGWTPFILAAAVLVLDGVDGWLARKLEACSDFGARFDMETDAFSLLAIACLVWQNDKAGPWVLLAGLMRYAFVAVIKAVPEFAAPLPPSFRRKAAFVIVAMTLISCLAPIVNPPLSLGLALAGLLTLTASFTIDMAYLARTAGQTSS
jgi:phosphatidylglycerophosphate synthase